MLYDLFYSVGNIALLITPYALPALVFLKFGWGFFFISIVFLIIAAVLSPFTIMLIADKWIFYKITLWKFPFDISLGFITTVMYLHHF